MRKGLIKSAEWKASRRRWYPYWGFNCDWYFIRWQGESVLLAAEAALQVHSHLPLNGWLESCWADWGLMDHKYIDHGLCFQKNFLVSFATTSCVTFKKLLNFLKPQIPLLYNGDTNNDYLIKLFEGSNELMLCILLGIYCGSKQYWLLLTHLSFIFQKAAISITTSLLKSLECHGY